MRKLLAAAAFLVLSTIGAAAQYTPPPAGSLVVSTCGAQAFPLLNNGKPNYAATTILQNGNLCTGASGGSGGSTTITGPLGPSTTAAQSVATTFGAGTLLPAFAAPPTVNQGNAPWADNITQWAGTTLGAPTAYGTAPTGVVPGFNAFVTNFPAGAATAALQIGQQYTLLTNASASGTATPAVAAGGYCLNLTGTFGGATFSLLQTPSVGAASTVPGSTFTAAPASQLCFVGLAGTTYQGVITGGSGTSLSANLVSSGSGALPNANSNVTPTVSGDIIINPSSSFTRTGPATAYASGQLVANSTTAGSVVPLSWTAARVAAGNFYIRRAIMTSTGKSVTNASFVLHVYKVTPTIANGDGAAWSTTLANLACDIPISLADIGSDVATGWGTPSVGSECNIALASGQTVYGLLSATAAYTPTSGETETVVLEVHQN